MYNPLTPLRQASAELLASSLLEMFPNILLWDTGVTYFNFTCDLIVPFTLTEEHLTVAKERMRMKIKQGLLFDRLEMVSRNASDYLHHHKLALRAKNIDFDQQFAQIIRLGDYINYVPGEMELDCSKIGAFEIERVESLERFDRKKSYKIERIWGTAFPTKEELKAHLKRMKAALLKDHREVGRLHELFELGEGPWEGEVFWSPKGTKLRDDIIKNWTQLMSESGFKKISTTIGGDIFANHLNHFKKFGKRFFELGDEGSLPDDEQFYGENDLWGLKNEVPQAVGYGTIFTTSKEIDQEINSCLQMMEKFIKIIGLQDGSFSSKEKGGVISYEMIDPYGRGWEVMTLVKERTGAVPNVQLAVRFERLIALLLEEGITVGDQKKL